MFGWLGTVAAVTTDWPELFLHHTTKKLHWQASHALTGFFLKSYTTDFRVISEISAKPEMLSFGRTSFLFLSGTSQ